MPKRKQVLVSRRYIDFVKDKLPFSDQDYWWELNPEKLKKKEWLPPSIIPTKKDKDMQEGQTETKMQRKIKKLKLKYTTVEVKKGIEEDEESLKDVQKLEKHLKEDISKAKEKIEQQ